MAVWGMDPDQLRQFAKALQTDIDKLDDIAKTMSSKVQSLSWKGPDATAFKNNWDTQYAKEIRSVSTALAGVASSANTNAQEQTEASS